MVRHLTLILLLLVTASFLACKTHEQSVADYNKYFQQGYTLTQEGKHNESITYYRQAIHALPNDARTTRAYNNLGWALLKQGKDQEAIQAFQKAIELSPDNERAINNLKAAKEHLANQP